MENVKKTISTSINLPVESILTIIDVDDKNVEIKIEDALKKFKNNETDSIRSMNTQITINNVYEMQNQRSVNLDNIDVLNDTFQIVKIEKKKIEKTNDIKFFKVKIDFLNESKKEFIVPSYVKFYSSHRGMFIPVEYIRNRDILLDYTGNIAKVADAEHVPDFKMTNFYNINVTYDVIDFDIKEDADMNRKHLNENCNFYLNGILSNISYNNFQKKD